MKKYFLTLLLCFSFINYSQAQTQKGTKLVGGSGFLEVESIYLDFRINPDLGYFLWDNVAIGSSIPFNFYSSDYNKDFGIGLQPFVRYYFGKESKTRILAELNFGFGLNKHRFSPPGPEGHSFTSRYNSFGAGVGAVHFLTPQIGLEALLNYNNQRYNDGGYVNNYHRRGRLYLTIGFQIHLPGSKSSTSPSE